MKTREDWFSQAKERGRDHTPFDDYSSAISPAKHKGKAKAWEWKGSVNKALIQEDSLQRTLKFINGNESFAILSAHRKGFTKEENIKRNRELRAVFNAKKMGVHQLVGHWLEKQEDGTEAEVAERSYLVVKPKYMLDSDFYELVLKCLTIDGHTQDAAVVKFTSKDGRFCILNNDGSIQPFSSKVDFSKNAIALAKAYSQHVKKTNTPFVFDGEEVPQTVLGMMLYEKAGFIYS